MVIRNLRTVDGNLQVELVLTSQSKDEVRFLSRLSSALEKEQNYFTDSKTFKRDYPNGKIKPSIYETLSIQIDKFLAKHNL